MNEISFDESTNSGNEMLPEYQFDYNQAKPNRFASQTRQPENIVVLDEDVAKVFTTSESVNKVLRALIESMPQASN
jgi:hypothetical protein